MSQVIVFAVLQLLNVFISTIKSVVTVNGSRLSAALVNSISYTFGAVITVLLVKQPFVIALCVTFTTNLIGVYLAKLLLERTRRIKVWNISATIYLKDSERLQAMLKERSIEYTLLPAENNRCLLFIYSYSKAESLMAREILSTCKTKYSVMEVDTSL